MLFGPSGSGKTTIIDLVTGQQPLANEDRTVWTVFKGEIFNYVELREELVALGHRFRTSSDTEVIVQAWEQWGEASVDRFNGQWAIALWDVPRRRLFLSRDRLGVRPLYHATVGDRFFFASPVKAIFADPAVPLAIDPAGLDEVFTFWTTVAPRTVRGDRGASPRAQPRARGPRLGGAVAAAAALLEPTYESSSTTPLPTCKGYAGRQRMKRSLRA